MSEQTQEAGPRPQSVFEQVRELLPRRGIVIWSQEEPPETKVSHAEETLYGYLAPVVRQIGLAEGAAHRAARHVSDSQRDAVSDDAQRDLDVPWEIVTALHDLAVEAHRSIARYAIELEERVTERINNQIVDGSEERGFTASIGRMGPVKGHGVTGSSGTS